MKRMFMSTVILALLFTPFSVYSQPDQSSKKAPPVSQSLVPEGDFALKLAPALGLGTPSSEAQAEDMLTSVGVAPKNGWIADYPVTPIVVGELQNAVIGAADSRKLPLGKDDALKAFQNLTVEFGLAIVPGGPGPYAENQPQPDSSMITDYYYEEGPPVITYYPPPWDYDYLYAWVPYPFWWGGFFFSGFFCLHDFHRFVFVGHHRFLISNHFINPVTHVVTRVDPVSHTQVHVSQTAVGFGSATTKNSAASIFNRSSNSMGSTTFNHPNHVTNGSGTNLHSSQTFGKSSGSFSGSGTSSCANCHGNSGSFGPGGGGSGSKGFSSSHSSGGFSGAHSSWGSSGGHSSGGFSGGHSSGSFSGSHSSGSFSGGGFSGGHGGGGRGR